MTKQQVILKYTRHSSEVKMLQFLHDLEDMGVLSDREKWEAIAEWVFENIN